MGLKMVEAECPVCGASIDLEDVEPGDVLECPNCGAMLKVKKRGTRYYLEEVIEEESEEGW